MTAEQVWEWLRCRQPIVTDPDSGPAGRHTRRGGNSSTTRSSPRPKRRESEVIMATTSERTNYPNITKDTTTDGTIAYGVSYRMPNGGDTRQRDRDSLRKAEDWQAKTRRRNSAARTSRHRSAAPQSANWGRCG